MLVIGGKEFVVAAGPCALESKDQLMQAATGVASAGARLLRAGAFKPRTSPYAFQGLAEEGLHLLAHPGRLTGLPTITEVLVEVHPTPDLALCDGTQSITAAAFASLIRELAALVPIKQRQLAHGRDIASHRGRLASIDDAVDRLLMAKEYLAREKLIDHLQRLAYYGFSAIIGIGNLVDRSDLHGGRTHWGDVPLRVRDEIIPGAALFHTVGTGIAWPGSGANGHPSGMDVPYPVTTVEEAHEAVRDNIRIKPDFIKIWVDDRGGRTKNLTDVFGMSGQLMLQASIGQDRNHLCRNPATIGSTTNQLTFDK